MTDSSLVYLLDVVERADVRANIVCPTCGRFTAAEPMPINSCLFFYECTCCAIGVPGRPLLLPIVSAVEMPRRHRTYHVRRHEEGDTDRGCQRGDAQPADRDRLRVVLQYRDCNLVLIISLHFIHESEPAQTARP